MGRTQNRIFGTLRVWRLRARDGLAGARDAVRGRRRTPPRVPARVEETPRRQ